MTPVDIVLIGRNEGARLIACLDSVQGQARHVVYVDSGSDDDSLHEARKRNAKVVELDMSIPFTAARARNAGFDALEDPELVLFIDGDCVLASGFVEAARDYLNDHPEVGMVTGWRSEIHPEASPYNLLCDWEWHRPPGEIMACGGDMMVRAALWQAVGGMNPQVIAAEDDEICCRFRKSGHTLWRIPSGMTRHDADMLRFGQWWTRAVRTGHGFAQVHHLHPDYFTTECRRAYVYALALPLFALAVAVVWWPFSLPILGVYALNWARSTAGLRRDGIPLTKARYLGFLLSLSKFPNLIGMVQFHLRRLTGRDMRIIEYK